MIGSSRRLGWAIVVVWFVVTATFAMTAAIPADPATRAARPARDARGDRARARALLPRPRRRRRSTAATLDRLVARRSRRELPQQARRSPTIIADRIWPTVQLALAAIVLQLADRRAARRDRRDPPQSLAGSRARTCSALLGQSAPTFFIGTLAALRVRVSLRLVPDRRLRRRRARTGCTTSCCRRRRSRPSASRTTRASCAPRWSTCSARTTSAPRARRACRSATSSCRHALRNALGPLVTLVGLDLGVLLGGAVVTESIFAWPGLGREVLQAILEVDIPLILGVVLVSAIAIAVANLLVDLVYLWLDPRLRD